ncbi:PREDICTED: uncharacterized protein LOC109226074 [Nicotiana attenuata]|uniref:uncharacterized protein LOC109226074 n=1 Tax=Nicotiana attenuata TaxID=49451 RepID=UPI000905C20D|nr:PREDICTED: uncharacterized protein LOC109226074 [Nicotiana attenuata]
MVPSRLKGKFYRVVIRPAMLYEAKCCAVNNSHFQKLKVAETRMLRWMCWYARRDRIRNEVIRDKVGVASMEEKLRQVRLRWYGNVRNRCPEAPVRRCERLHMRDLRKGRGRPKMYLGKVIRHDMTLLQLTKDMTLDRKLWRLKIRIKG